MDLVSKLPSLEDSALAVLHENAERLEQSGSAAQRSAAAALIPAIEAERAAPRAAKPAPAKRAPRTVAKKASSGAAAKPATKRKAKPA
jgi:hypothetical protein